MTGRIILAATPIGNVDDASPRLRAALAEADVIAAEDTRRVRDLATRLGVRIAGTVLALHDHNERARADDVVARARAGATVLVVSDAGMPTVSDPGFRVVEAAVSAGIEVTVLPGPSAALAALAISGLPSDRFCFEGFLPRAGGQRGRALAALAHETRTLIFFEAPHRLAETLDAMVVAFGAERRAVVARELTKTHEEIRRGTLAEIRAWAAMGPVLGEIAVVVAGAPPQAASLQVLAAEAFHRAEQGERLKAVTAELAEASGLASRDIYAEALALRSRRPRPNGGPPT